MKVFWWVSVVIALVAVAATATVGVAYHRAYSDVESAPPYQLAPAELPVTPVEPSLADDGSTISPAAGFQAPAIDGQLGAAVVDLTTQESVYEHDAHRQLVPASSTKIVTATAALASMDLDKRLHTVIEHDGAHVVIRAAGDVWLDDAALDAAAAAIGHADSVEIDTSLWSGPTQAEGWDPGNVAEGYIAPMEPAMLYGGRIGATEGDVPRSHTPALDVAGELAKRLGTDKFAPGTVTEGAEELASVESAPLSERALEMVRHSDNVMAEAIARELADARGKQPSFQADTQATLDVLREHGFDVSGVDIKDNSGLSVDNRLSASVLAEIVNGAVEEPQLRPLTAYLPVAGGDGTLHERYGESAARGFVRAKTGTLTGVSALAGTAQGQSGRVYSFAFLVNDGEIMAARAAQDDLAAALHEF